MTACLDDSAEDVFKNKKSRTLVGSKKKIKLVELFEIAIQLPGFRCPMTKVHHQKLYNMSHFLTFNVLLLSWVLSIVSY